MQAGYSGAGVLRIWGRCNSTTLRGVNRSGGGGYASREIIEMSTAQLVAIAAVSDMADDGRGWLRLALHFGGAKLGSG